MQTSTMRPVPLVFVLEEMNFGGTQRQTLELARCLNKELFSPEIWTMRAGDALLHTAQEYGIPVKMLRQDATLRPFLAAYALWKELRKERPLFMHLGTVFPNVWGRLLGTVCKVPIIVGGCKGQGNIRLQHERFLRHLAHAHICDAMSIKLALQDLGVPRPRVHCITNGVNVDFFTPAPQRVLEPEILCVGRMVEEKDHATLLHAFALVMAQMPKARLYLVGEGPLQGELQKLAQSLGVHTNVVFHGSSNVVLEHMHKARTVVLSSISEGTPNVLLEAMACALPVVATAVAGIPDMVQHEVQGLLVPSREPEPLSQALLRVLQEDALAQQWGEAGRAHVCEAYSLENVARKHEEVYRELCRRVGL